MKPKSKIPLTSAFVLAAASVIYAQETAAPAPAAAATPPAAVNRPVESWLHGKVPDAISQGKFLFNVRARYEYADQFNLRHSNAPTVRTRLGYETAPLYGFRGMLEFEDVTILGNENNFNQAGLSGPGRTPVGDPETTELNQGWLSYQNWETLAKFGRQRITLDNHRFVGNVGWRQNEQTYDGVTVQNKSIPDTTLLYGYIHNVNRVFGDDHPMGDFESDSHLIQAAYSGFSLGTITPYAYLLDLENSPRNSANTFGASFSGGYALNPETNTKLNYRAEFAWQEDAGANPVNYDAIYYNFELGADCKIYSAGAGVEVLGSGERIGFSTPLATLHAFNGWADNFLVTPANGLRDVYAWAGVELPFKLPLKVVFHDYRSETGGMDYGTEWDAMLSRKFGKHWTAMVKAAYYDGKPPYVDVQKFWAQLEFNY